MQIIDDLTPEQEKRLKQLGEDLNANSEEISLSESSDEPNKGSGVRKVMKPSEFIEKFQEVDLKKVGHARVLRVSPRKKP